MKALIFLFSRSLSFSSGFCMIFSLLLYYSCGIKQDSVNRHSDIPNQDAHRSSIRHAVGFDLLKEDQYQVLHLFRHYNEVSDTLSFILKIEGAEIDPQFEHIDQIQVPLYNIALLHSSYLAFFDLLHAGDHLAAISEGKYIYDPQWFGMVSSGALPEVGYGESLDKEKLLALGASTVLTVGWPNVPNKSRQILGELGIPVLIFSDWQETTLLGRLEWIKVIAAIIGKEEAADSIFSEVESRYEALKSLTGNVGEKPNVICNLPYKGSWYMPGGSSYISNVLSDAGANYLWSDHPGTGGVQIDFEAVFARGLGADFWINPGYAEGVKDIIDNDERLKDFHALERGRVFNHTKRITRDVANDYWESGIVQPDVVLADLIRIFHPELLPDHELYYYQKLN